MPELEEIAEALGTPSPSTSPKLASSFDATLTIEDAYTIQRLVADARMAAGDRVVGRKVGLADPAAQRSSGVDEPIAGRLMASGHLPVGGRVDDVARDPAALECELALVLGRELAGPGVTVEAALDAVDGVVPAFEIIEMRLPPTATVIDMVADNCSGAGFVVGADPIPPRRLDLATARVTLEGDRHTLASQVIGEASSEPVMSLVWLANHLGRIGEHLRVGDVVLTGAIVPPVPTSQWRDFRATYDGGLGSIQVVGGGV